MVPQVALLSMPNVNWVDYAKVTKAVLGYNISQSLDKARLKPDSMGYYLCSLAAVEEENPVYGNVLREPGHLLDHLFFSFIIVCDSQTRLDLAIYTPLSIVTAESIAATTCNVVSGTLADWRASIVNGSVLDESYSIRTAFNKCLVIFESLGLGRIWSEYSKVQLPDQTFRLEEK